MEPTGRTEPFPQDHHATLSAGQLSAALAAANRKIAVLKDQLMSEQAAAEEAEQQRVLEALAHARAGHEAQVLELQQQVRDREERVHQLDLKLRSERSATADLVQHDNTAAARIQELEASEGASRARVAEATRAQQRLTRQLEERTEEVTRLEVAMGEMAYQAESATKLQLRCQQLQAELDSMVGRLKSAEAATATAVQAAQQHEAAAGALRGQLLQAEERCMGLQAKLAAEASQREELEAAAKDPTITRLSETQRQELLKGIMEWMCRNGQDSEYLARITSILRLSEQEQSGLRTELEAVRRSNGVLQKLGRLPARLVARVASPRAADGPHGANGSLESGSKVSIATDWTKFLLEDGDEHASATQTSIVER